MPISTHNRFAGTVAAIKEGAVNGTVTVEVGGLLLKAGTTMDSICRLGLVEGSPAEIVVRETAVMFTPGARRLPVSARNQIAGRITRIEHDGVEAVVSLAMPDGGPVVTGVVAASELDGLGLEVGSTATALIKATDVLIGIPE